MTSSHIEHKISRLLQHCSFRQLKQIHGLLVTAPSLSWNPALSSRLLRRSTEFGDMWYAELLFFASDGPDILLWNAMIRGYAYNGPHVKSLHMYERMPERGLRPNSFTYPYVLDACVHLGDLREGKKIHCRVIKAGLDGIPSVGSSLFNLYTNVGNDRNGKLDDGRRIFDRMTTRSVGLWNRMISEYANLGDVESARRLFDEMLEKDVVTWNTMIAGYVRVMDVESARDLFGKMPEKNVVSWTSMIGAFADSGDLRTARRLFDEMPERNTVSWNCVIASYAKHRKFEQALDLFFQMRASGVAPDGFTFVSALSVCAHLGALEIGQWIHFHLIRDGFQLGAIVGTALVEMYARCGDVDGAFRAFIKMVEKDVFCWNVMIKSLAIHGRIEDAMRLFDMMRKEGLRPNNFTFTNMLFACNHGGLVGEGRMIFGMMSDFGIRPNIEHYGCLIDLLGRNGRLEEAQLVMKGMPYKPDVAVWGALLGGCRVRNDIELAEKAMKGITELSTSEAGVYVLMSNIYAASGRWSEALNARHKIERKAIWKTAGCSSVLQANVV